MPYELTREQNSLGGKRGQATLAADRAEKRRLMHAVWEITDGLERADVTELAFAAIVNSGLALAEQRLPAPETTLDAVRLMDVMTAAHKIMRLELGESTSNTLTGNVDPDVLAQRLANLRRTVAPIQVSDVRDAATSQPATPPT